MAQKMNPFPGLRPFEMQEKYLFFGREDQRAAALAKRCRRHLRQRPCCRNSSTMTDAGSSWEIAVMRPGGDHGRTVGTSGRSDEESSLVQAVSQSTLLLPELRSRRHQDRRRLKLLIAVMQQTESDL